MKVYMAGKISGDEDWRHTLVDDLYPESHDPVDFDTVLEGAVDGGHDYVGPFYRYFGGHGFERGDNTHSCGLGPMAISALVDWKGERYDPFGVTNHLSKARLFMECRHQIERADIVFAWLDDVTAYGTLVEIGMARARDKEIWIGGYPIEDLWFAFAAATVVEFVQSPSDTPKVIWNRLVSRLGKRVQEEIEEDRSYRELRMREHADAAQFVQYVQRNKPNQLRADVWSKTGGICWYCGGELNPFLNFHVEHQHPRSKGGSDRLDNLVPACRDCNLSKGDLTVNEFRWRRGVTKFHGETLAIAAGEGA